MLKEKVELVEIRETSDIPRALTQDDAELERRLDGTLVGRINLTLFGRGGIAFGGKNGRCLVRGGGENFPYPCWWSGSVEMKPGSYAYWLRWLGSGHEVQSHVVGLIWDGETAILKICEHGEWEEYSLLKDRMYRSEKVEG